MKGSVKPEYFPLYTSDKRYFFITGGRGSLKSSHVHAMVAKLTFDTGEGILFTRYTMTSAEKSIIPEFQIVCDRLGLTRFFKITRNVVTNVLTGSFIYFSGIKAGSKDQTGNLKSIAGITTWIVEEGEDFNDEKAFEKIDDSIRTVSKQNRVIVIMNPTTKEHFFHDKFIKPKNKQIIVQGYRVTVSDVPNVEHIHTTYHIGLEFLDHTWLEKAEGHRKEAERRHSLPKDHPEYQDKHNSHYYHNYVGGWKEKAEGVIFEQWIEGQFDTSLPAIYGLDFGYFPDPNALVKVAIDKKKKRIYLHEEFYNTKQSTDQLISSLERIGKRSLIVADNSEPRTIADIRKAGYNITAAKKGPDSVKNGIKTMQGYTLIITKESKNLKTELNNYAWNDKKSSTPIDKYNHLIDAARYGVSRLVKGRSKGVKRRN